MTDRLFKAVIQNSLEAILVLSKEGTLLYANPAAERILHYGPQELVGKQIAQLADAPSSDSILHNPSSNESDQATTWFECSLRTKNGHTVMVDASATRMSVDDTSVAIILTLLECRKVPSVLKRIEEEHRMFCHAIEQAADHVMITDHNGIVEYVNPAFERISGYKSEEVVGKKADVLKSGKHGQEFYASLWNTVKVGHSWRGILTNKKKDGTLFYEEKVITPLRDERGRISCFISTGRDISERKRIEEALQLSEHRLARAQQIAHMGNWEWNLKTGSVFWSKTIYEIVGLSSDECVPSFALCLDIVHPDDRRRVKHSIRRALRMHENGTLEHRIVLRTGEERCVCEYFEVVCDEQGAPEAIVGTLQDITEMISAGQALRDSEERYRALFEESISGNFVIAPDGTILSCNEAFAKVFGFASPQEAIGNTVTSLFDDRSGQKTLNELLRLGKQAEMFEIKMRKVDGTSLQIVANCHGVFDHQRNLTEVRGNVHDNSKQKKLEEELLQSQKLESIGVLAGGIAHNFNNLLQIILAYTLRLQEMLGDRQQLRPILARIEQTAERGATMVKQILAFARRTPVHVESISVNDCIGDLSSMLRETFPREISIQMDLSKGELWMAADQNQFQQVLLNICMNARDAMPKGGSLHLRSGSIPHAEIRQRFGKATSDEYVHVAISDTGIGMDEETRSRIFEPFFTTKEKGRGTGLGLAVAYGIIESHGGFISVESTQNVGTTFHLFFPLQMAARAKTHLRMITQQSKSHHSETILIIEDEEATLDLMQAMFQEQGYHILGAPDGTEGLRIYQERWREIDLVISDYGLPGMNGIEMLAAMKKLNPALRAMLASGYTTEPLQSVREHGIVDVIHKPFRPEDVFRRVREILREEIHHVA